MDIQRNRVRNCYKFNTKTNELSRIADIITGRSAFGIVNIRQYIYVISGSQGLQGCERYDIMSDKWEEYQELPYDLVAVTATKYKERYLIAMGGMNYLLYSFGYDHFMNQMLVIDTLSVEPEW
jgi:hypothetical protein